jgi:hypothetical protein
MTPKKSQKHSSKKSKSEVIVTEDAIVITLTEEQKKKIRHRLRVSGKAKFKIDDIMVDSIPSVRVYDRPIHCP